MKQADDSTYRAAVYTRTSKGGTEKAGNDSIENQKNYIYGFLKDKPEIEVEAEFTDEGYTGVHIERPALSRLLAEIEAGCINCIIVKDLSRFSRNYSEAGRFLEYVFPNKNIRFIAIDDGYDSLNAYPLNDLLIPFKHLINDSYCRDISIKIRSCLQTKRLKGDFISSFAAYGYMKAKDNRHKIVVDKYAANVVRDIFNMKFEGISQQRIANILNEKGVLSPLDYKRYCGSNFKSGFQINIQSKWSAVAIGRILKNDIYTGTLSQGKRSTPNHKVRKSKEKPESEWVRIQKNHEPIISCEIFSIVNNILRQDIRVAPQKEVVYPLSGLLFCGDCGMNMVRSSVRQKGKTYSYYMCLENRTRKTCTSHRISVKKLEETVLQVLTLHVNNLIDDERISEYIKSLPDQYDELEQTNILINQKMSEIERYIRLKSKLKGTLADGHVNLT